MAKLVDRAVASGEHRLGARWRADRETYGRHPDCWRPDAELL